MLLLLFDVLDGAQLIFRLPISLKHLFFRHVGGFRSTIWFLHFRFLDSSKCTTAESRHYWEWAPILNPACHLAPQLFISVVSLEGNHPSSFLLFSFFLFFVRRTKEKDVIFSYSTERRLPMTYSKMIWKCGSLNLLTLIRLSSFLRVSSSFLCAHCISSPFAHLLGVGWKALITFCVSNPVILLFSISPYFFNLKLLGSSSKWNIALVYNYCHNTVREFQLLHNATFFCAVVIISWFVRKLASRNNIAFQNVKMRYTCNSCLHRCTCHMSHVFLLQLFIFW